MKTFRIEIEYDGTRYSGWQVQPHARTVQGELIKAAETVFAQHTEISGAGRTDAGVHALTQVAHIRVENPSAIRDVRSELNKLLPHDINVLTAGSVSNQFHARHDAQNRFYLYQISTRRSAFAKNYVWWVRDPLNLRAMSGACTLLRGRHDFSSFCEQPEKSGTNVVQVDTAELFTHGSLILFRIGASHFLWKMVRRIVGTLVEVGRGNLDHAAIAKLLQQTDGQTAQWTAPPSGLFLERVMYAGDLPPGERKPAFAVRK